MRSPIVFDCETGPASDAAEYAPDFEAPSNYKDPVKIAAYKAEKLTEWINQAALSAVTGELLAIGLREDGKTTILCSDERSMLVELWAYVAPDGVLRAPLIGFNSNRFDIPFLVRRSWRHGVQPARGLMRGRYMSDGLIDLMQVWQLGTLARWLGVGAKSGDGAAFAELLKTDREAALDYLRNDVELTERCAVALGILEAPVAAAAAGGDY
jgi:hypothetical protein